MDINKMSKVFIALCLAILVVGFTCFSTGCASSSVGSSNSNGSSAAGASTQTITDMAGRDVTIPTDAKKVMGAANPDGIMVYSIDPDMCVGWTFDLNESAKKYLDPSAASLPKITSISKWEAPNEEEILNISPDFILVSVDLTNVDLSLYDQITSDTGVPVVVVDAELQNLGNTYRFLGSILGDSHSTQCNELADYVDQTFTDVNATMAKVPTRTRVLYSTGNTGLQTCGDSNWNGQFVTPAGGINVCDTTQTSGFSTVSMEQILSWQPEVIISTVGDSAASVYSTDEWSKIGAVQNHMIYSAPKYPFSWVDKPTGANRVIGVKWTNDVLYHDQATYDISKDVTKFYSLFYHYNLSDSEVNDLLTTKVQY
ncbi:MAG: ABC transporter substrate-binding protein [Eggerthellaceae bacterium]|nr:ABC transporter substrate-binding protein [Eggerthellaceae bacterium]MCH4220429.1 ABC transporter substrate-binding protein [Eggerthellaceae bacterium]